MTVHILFGGAASGSLKVTLKKMGLNKEEKVISFWDIFAVGPIWKLHEECGRQFRFEWVKRNISDEFCEFPSYTQRFTSTLNELNEMHDGGRITIWTSNSAHEQVGFRFVLYLLKEKNMNISVMNVTEEFERIFCEKEVTYSLLHTGELSPEQFQTLYEYRSGRVLTDQDRRELEKEWIHLSETRETLRIWTDGEIVHVPEDYYDKVMINKAKELHGKQMEREFLKSARVIGEGLGFLDQYVGDLFLEYRLRKLIEAGIFESEGCLRSMRFYCVRLKS